MLLIISDLIGNWFNIFAHKSSQNLCIRPKNSVEFILFHHRPLLHFTG